MIIIKTYESEEQKQIMLNKTAGHMLSHIIETLTNLEDLEIKKENKIEYLKCLNTIIEKHIKEIGENYEN